VRLVSRRRSEADARRSEARLARAQRAARIGTWEFDLRTGDVWWSDEMYRVFPRYPATWKPTNAEFFGSIIPEDRDRLPIPTSPPASSDSPYCFTARFEVAPGRVRHLRVEGVVECDADGVPVEMFGTTQDVTEHMRADERLREYQRQLRELASQISLAEERERRRIAGGLHDRAIQMLALSQIKLGALRNSLEGDPNRTRLIDEVRSLVDQSIHDTRSLVFELSPPVLHELGFEAAVESLAELVEYEHALHCKVKSAGTPIRMAADVEISLFQAVREALINTVKHARATNALVTLDWRGPEAIAVCVEDDGAGFDVGEVETRRSRAGGFGLFSMRERLGVLGGRAEVTSARGNGTRVRLEMPLPAPLSPT
jgi:signal transduction histidine kinase